MAAGTTYDPFNISMENSWRTKGGDEPREGLTTDRRPGEIANVRLGAVLCGNDFNLPVESVKNRFGCVLRSRWPEQREQCAIVAAQRPPMDDPTPILASRCIAALAIA